MIDFARFVPTCLWHQIQPLIDEGYLAKWHGDWAMWQARFANLPGLNPSHIDIADVIRIGIAADAPHHLDALEDCARELIPWRKGPFSLFGIEIDAEWRSDQKWHRLAPHLDCVGKMVLDVGANNGYYMFRAQQLGAAGVVGLDAQLKAALQFYMLQKYAQRDNVALIPLRLETVAERDLWRNQFDVVLALGTLYHARNPILHLTQLRDRLARKGKLVLETLIIDDAENTLIAPQITYMRMKNVWFVTSVDIVCAWLTRLGFSDIQVLDVTYTEITEQRRTDWMPFSSLQDGLHATNPRLTAEQLPRAKRALLSANV